MPITRKVRDDNNSDPSEGENGERNFTSFMHKARWFAISQTIGDEFTPPRLPDWEAERALAGAPTGTKIASADLCDRGQPPSYVSCLKRRSRSAFCEKDGGKTFTATSRLSATSRAR
jgi:hypothetical protein